MSREITNQTDGYTLSDNLHILPRIIKTFLPRSDAATLGDFEKFPREILDMVLLSLDLDAIVQFRGVNIRARDSVDSHVHYSNIFKHAPEVLCALHQSQLAAHTTCEQLLRTLRLQKCSRCSENGAYLHLLTCTRVCWKCFNSSEEFLPMRRKEALIRCAFNATILKTIPCLKVKRGKYGHREPFESDAGYFYDRPTVKSTAMAKDDARQMMLARAVLPAVPLLQRSLSRRDKVMRRYLENYRGQGSLDVSRSLWQYCVVARLPWLSSKPTRVHWGQYCKSVSKAATELYFSQRSRLMSIKSMEKNTTTGSHVRKFRFSNGL